MIGNQKKRRKYGNEKILHKYPSKRSFTNGIHSLLKATRADSRALIAFTLYATHIASLPVSYWRQK